MRRSHAIAAALICLIPAACEPEVPEGLRPGQLLRDSLGLGDEDVVHEIGLRSVDGDEAADPPGLTLEPPGWLVFRSDDPRPRRVQVDTLPLDAAQRDFVRPFATGTLPLIRDDARWIRDFGAAPPGVYPFRVSGTGRETIVRIEVPIRD